MEKDSLKKWRLILPGIIILILSIPYRSTSIDELKNINSMLQNINWKDLYLLGVMVIFGVLYYSLNIRWIVWKTHNNKIQSNIKTKILSLCDESMNPEVWYKIIHAQYLMTIFYSIIDNDASLKDKAKDVRLNGLIWSSIFDIQIVSGAAGSIYWLIALFCETKTHLIYLSPILFVISFIFLGLSYLLTYRHTLLSNEQLNVISQRYRDQVNAEVRKVISDNFQ